MSPTECDRGTDIAVLGSGVVGRAPARGYTAHGHSVCLGTRQPDVDGPTVAPPAKAVARAGLVVLRPEPGP